MRIKEALQNCTSIPLPPTVLSLPITRISNNDAEDDETRQFRLEC